MSKHHAPEEEAPASEMSWIRGLARPADQAPDATLPFYGSLVARAPRHARGGEEAADVVPAVSQTGPIRRISASQVDTLIGRLDGLSDAPADQEVQDAPERDEHDSAEQDTAEQDAVDVAGQASGDDHGFNDHRLDDHDNHPNAASIDRSDDLPETPGEFGTESPHEVAMRSDVSVQVDDTDQVDATALVDPTEMPVTDEPSGRRVLSRPARARLRKPVLVGAAAALCLLTVGGGTVTAMEKTVSIVIDGKTQKVSTMAGSVAGALAAAGITATGHDAVAPAVDASIADGSTIVLQRGRLMTVTVDGQQQQIWTTARNAQEAEAQLGSRSSADLALAANRSRAIPLVDTARALAATPRTSETIRTVTVSVAGGLAKQSTTAASTVGELLTALDIGFGPYDTVSPANGTKLRNGLVIKVNRVSLTTTTSEGTLAPPAATSVDDATIVKGTSTVVQQSKPGSEVITYTVTTVNGRQVSKAISGRKTLVKAVGQVTHVGTKSGFTYSGSEVFTNDTEFGVNWDGLAMCESTHNPKAINANPSAGLPTYGMFQFDLPTWESVGGSGNPIDASPEEQLMRAKLLFQSRGLEPWACRDAAH